MADDADGRSTVRLHDVHKTFALGARRVDAVRGAELRIDGPGYYAIMGPSGSGKSTLLHLMAGLDRPDRGTVHVAGRAVHELDERALTRFRRHDVGIVFQQFNLISTLDALENVTLPALLDGVPPRERRERGEHLLDALGVADRATHRPDALSGGEQQRVALARALVFEPPVLLADEPTGNLDTATSEAIWSLLGEIAASRGMTVVMITHEPSAAVHCRRVFVQRDGRIQGSFDVDGIDAAELATRAQHVAG